MLIYPIRVMGRFLVRKRTPSDGNLPLDFNSTSGMANHLGRGCWMICWVLVVEKSKPPQQEISKSVRYSSITFIIHMAFIWYIYSPILWPEAD